MKFKFSFLPLLFLFLWVGNTAAIAQSTGVSNAETDSPRVATIDSVMNYVPINDFLATAGQITYSEIPLLKQEGFDTVISLATANEENNGLEAFHVVSEGMGFTHIVLEGTPDMSELDAFFAAMNANQGKKVFVHCNSNRRASAFTYLYRVLVLGEDEDTARKELELMWVPEESEAWKALFDEAKASPKYSGK